MRPAGLDSLPMGYTRLEYLESDGSAFMTLPFEAKNKSFVCEHTLGMPKATSGLYVYGGTPVSAGYGIRYNAYNQALGFTGGDWYGPGTFLRGEKYKILWKVTPREEGRYIFSMEYDSKVLTSIIQDFNAYWENVYYVFGSTKYDSRIGGATYELTISIEGKLTCHVVPALDPTGTPCMVDLVSMQPFRNAGTGQFIAGMTLGQALKLKDLPAKTATLDISLPEGYEAHEEVMESIRQAEEKGWTLNKTTYTPT